MSDSSGETGRRWAKAALLAGLLCVLAFFVFRRLFPTPLPAPAAAVRSGPLAGMKLVPWFSKLRFQRPVFLTEADDGSGRLYVLEQHGVIRRFANERDADRAEVFLDIAAKVSRAGNEEGLLGLAFHPRFKTNRELFVYYSAKDSSGLVGGASIVARYRLGKDGRADPASERVLLRVPQPYRNHNGGMIAFGPDGKLYVGLGDGGLAGDPHGHGLDLSTLLGAILRIDVDVKSGELAYGIPPDNPFVAREGARGEVWAYGLRNPWRFSFDKQTGELWVGDVGQNAWEEVHLVARGDNCGWRAYEGFAVYSARSMGDAGNAKPPLAAYGRGEGFSITGGYVYRGKRQPSLRGLYLYADYGSGAVWALRRDPQASANLSDPRHPTAEGVVVTKLLGRSGLGIASFGEDLAGELYVCAFDGRIYALEAK